MPDTFSQSDVNEMFSTPSRTIRSWVERGLVETVGSVRDGRGDHRLYSGKSLVQLAVVEILTTLNFPLDDVKRVMQRFFQRRSFPKEVTIAWVKAGRGLRMEFVEPPLTPIESSEALLTLRVEKIKERVDSLVKNS